MTAHKLGHELLRCRALLLVDRLLWQGCRFQGLGVNIFAHSRQRHAGLSCFLRTAQKGRSLVAYPGNTVKFYSQEGAGWQGLNNSGGQSLSPDNPGDAMDLPFPPEEDMAAVYSKEDAEIALFIEQLNECNSPTDVLDLISRCTLKLRMVSFSLMRTWETTKRMTEKQSRYERQLMFDHPSFRQLCTFAMQSASGMRSIDLTFSLLAVMKLDVPQGSRLVQTLLRAIQEKLNECDEKALSVLATCLGDMESRRNVVALRKGLRLLVGERASGIESVMALQNLMRCVGRDAPLGLKRRLEKKALSMVDQFSLLNCQHMVTTLAAMDFNSKPLLDICSKQIAEKIHNIPSFWLLNILKACKDLNYRDSHFLSAVAEHQTSTFGMWTNKQLILFLLTYEGLRFRPVALLDKYLERVIQDPNSLTLKDVISVLKVCSLLNHFHENRKQEFLQRMTSVFESYLSTMAPSDLLRGVFFLCILGHFPLAPLQKLLQKETLEELTKDGPFLLTNQRKLHYVSLCLQLDRPPFPKALTVPPGTIDLPVTGQATSGDWAKLLQRIAGDGVLQEGVVLEKTYVIDCLLTLPVQRADHYSLKEESEGGGLSPEPCHRVAVLIAPPSFFCLGTSHPRGMQVMMMRHLRALGYTPVPVPEHEFNSLSEEEKVEGLKTRIFPVKEAGAV